MTQDKISKVEKKDKILSLEQARGMEGFWDYRNGVYKYKQNGIYRLIHEGKDVAEELGAVDVWGVKFNRKGELAFTFKTEAGWGVRYNGEIFKEGWEDIWGVQFDKNGELVLKFETKKGYGVCYDGEVLGGEWKGVDIGKNDIEYKAKISYEEFKNQKKT